MRRLTLTLAAAVLSSVMALPAFAQQKKKLPVITLDQAIAAVRRANPDIRAARARLASASTTARKAWSAYLPQANIGGSYTRNSVAATLDFPNFAKGFDIKGTFPNVTATPKEIDKITIQDLNQFGAQLQVQQPIFLGPAIPGIMAAYKAQDIARLTEHEVERAILFGAAEAYYGAAGLKQAVHLNKQQLALLREHLRTAQAALAAGSVPELAVLRAKIDVSRAEQDVLRSVNAYATARGALATLMGRPDIDFDVATVGEPGGKDLSPEALHELVQKALGTRPDFLAANVGIDASELQKKVAWAKFLPVLGIGWDYRWSDVKGFTGKNTSWALMVTASIPIFEGGSRFAELDAAGAQIDEAKAQAESLRHRITQEVRQDLLDIASARANLSKADEQVRLARANWRAVESSFKVGASSSIDVADAAHALQAAELGQVAEAIQVRVARLKLHKDLGEQDPLAAIHAEPAAPPKPKTDEPGPMPPMGAPDAMPANGSNAPPPAPSK